MKIKMKPVHVTFLDHCSSNGDEMAPAYIDLFGVIVKEDAKAYYVASWVADGQIDSNSDCYTVIKHKGLKIRKLK